MASPTKWSNTLKQFVGNSCLSVFNHFVWLALKGLMMANTLNTFSNTLNQLVEQYFTQTHEHNKSDFLMRNIEYIHGI